MYLCDLVGLNRFSNATGIVNLFRGFGCFLGPVLSGLIADKFDEFKCFYFSAICFVVGLALSLMVSLLSVIQNRCLKRDESEIQVKVINDESDLNKNLLNRK